MRVAEGAEGVAVGGGDEYWVGCSEDSKKLAYVFLV